MQRNFEPMRRQVETWRARQLPDEAAKLVIYRAFVEGELEVPRHLARLVHNHYFDAQHEEFTPRTMWSLARLIELFPGRFEKIRLFVPEAYDLVLSKLTRNIERGRQEAEFLARTQHLDPVILRERYEKELRPILSGPRNVHDMTLEFWIKAYFARPSGE